jgi:hypothetical protein
VQSLDVLLEANNELKMVDDNFGDNRKTIWVGSGVAVKEMLLHGGSRCIINSGYVIFIRFVMLRSELPVT